VVQTLFVQPSHLAGQLFTDDGRSEFGLYSKIGVRTPSKFEREVRHLRYRCALGCFERTTLVMTASHSTIYLAVGHPAAAPTSPGAAQNADSWT
jgi:hypothetical protein